MNTRKYPRSHRKSNRRTDMTTKDEALNQALEALEQIQSAMPFPSAINAIKMCRAALAQKDEQDPVAWRFKERPDDSRSAWHYVAKKKSVPHGFPYQSLYTAPPGCRPLTDEEIIWMIPGLIDSLNDPYEQTPGCSVSSIKFDMVRLVRAVEAYYRTGAEHEPR